MEEITHEGTILGNEAELVAMDLADRAVAEMPMMSASIQVSALRLLRSMLPEMFPATALLNDIPKLEGEWKSYTFTQKTTIIKEAYILSKLKNLPITMRADYAQEFFRANNIEFAQVEGKPEQFIIKPSQTGSVYNRFAYRMQKVMPNSQLIYDDEKLDTMGAAGAQQRGNIIIGISEISAPLALQISLEEAVNRGALPHEFVHMWDYASNVGGGLESPVITLVTPPNTLPPDINYLNKVSYKEGFMIDENLAYLYDLFKAVIRSNAEIAYSGYPIELQSKMGRVLMVKDMASVQLSSAKTSLNDFALPVGNIVRTPDFGAPNEITLFTSKGASVSQIRLEVVKGRSNEEFVQITIYPVDSQSYLASIKFNIYAPEAVQQLKGYVAQSPTRGLLDVPAFMKTGILENHILPRLTKIRDFSQVVYDKTSAISDAWNRAESSVKINPTTKREEVGAAEFSAFAQEVTNARKAIFTELRKSIPKGTFMIRENRKHTTFILTELIFKMNSLHKLLLQIAK